MEKLKVVVMTQNDRFFIPMNIYKASKVCCIQEVVEVNCKSSLNNKIEDYFKWFGLLQCIKMGIVTIWREVIRWIDVFTKYKYKKGFCSVKDIAKVLDVPHQVITNSNDKEFVQHIRSLEPDLIISYSAPQVIKEELLQIPKFGIINVHGSLLPDFRGTLPSFWHLYKDQKTGGATVHYMSSKIDDGMIIEQESIDISDCKTMFQLMKKTKELGGELMVRAINNITNNSVQVKPNDSEQGNYYSWPTVEQAKEFMKKGYRLI